MNDSIYLIALLVIVPLNLAWGMFTIPWVIKRRIELYFVTAVLLTNSCLVHNFCDVFGVLASLIYFAFWVFQIQWTRPKYAYEL